MYRRRSPEHAGQPPVVPVPFSMTCRMVTGVPNGCSIKQTLMPGRRCRTDGGQDGLKRFRRYAVLLNLDGLFNGTSTGYVCVQSCKPRAA